MKLAFICRGKSDSGNGQPLQYLENSCNAVEKTLKQYEWQCENIELKKLDDYATILQNCTNKEEISELIFYFIGHGDFTTLLDFHILLEDETTEPYVEHIVNKTQKSCNDRLPSKMAIIIDSCYSGKIIDSKIITKKLHKHIEILTSSSDGEQSFESSSLKDGRTIFSHYFCEAIENDKLKLYDIKEYIYSKTESIIINKNTDDEDTVSQQPYCTPAQEKDKIVIGYNKEKNELQNYIRNHYSENVENFKKDMFSYLYNSPITLEKIHESKTFNSLFNLLIEEKECLYCLLKQINPKNTYLSQLIEKDCDKLRIKVDKSLRSKRLIFLIGLDSTDGKGKKIYSVASYIYTNRKTLRPISHVQVDFTEQINYEKHICMIIEKSKSMMPFDSSNELIFILPEVLHTIDFKKVVCENHKTIYDYNDIIIQSYTRYMHLDDKEEYIIKWNKNSDKYYKNIKNKLINHIYPIEVILEDMRFGKNFSREGESYVCVISSDYILDRIDDILNHGIPLVICPQYKEQRCETTISICDDVEIEGSKRELFKYVDNVHDQYGSQYYMHDLYKDAKEIKKLVDESLVDENKNETEYLS